MKVIQQHELGIFQTATSADFLHFASSITSLPICKPFTVNPWFLLKKVHLHISDDSQLTTIPIWTYFIMTRI